MTMHCIHKPIGNKLRHSALVWKYLLSILLLQSCAYTKNGENKNSSIKKDTLNTQKDTLLKRSLQFSIGNGVNLQPSYYNNGRVNFDWPLMKSMDKIKTVRIEIEPNAVQQAKEWIRQADSAGYTIIATYHKAKVLGSDDPAEVQEAANWWQHNYNTLISGIKTNLSVNNKNPKFIINLINEWGSHNMSAANYAKAYNAAIATLRTFYNGYIIIDIPGWGQETYTAFLACKKSIPKIQDSKIILSAHIYPNGFNQARGRILQPSDLKDMENTGYPCILGEFGTGEGACDWSAIVDYAKNHGWPVIGWAWNGDGGTMNMVHPAWKQEPQASSFKTSPYFDTLYNKL
ncbi:hypothetical protein SAMN05192529_10337 [Arachidicoccus rhizosphaerae]|uniref:Mannan endo-1,4-beta-mannosidase n=1 Tax=Arachidicoccus rhizosphaerae TaxID=551991 RepID=A0A1H3WHP3_9BACT|nr:hypothetical protein [Arachidicoccus rhizosphaerae]SDZ86649.1 hypothetical protein SAMN05192529_10337 [Arachidicoccus rhizosphaerae]